MLRIAILCFIATPCAGQYLSNPSFEGSPATGISPPSWFPCNEWSTPDTQPGSWDISRPASDGKTYISLVTRGTSGNSNDNFTEAIGTKLLVPFNSQTCYSFSVDVAIFPSFKFDIITYEHPVVLNVWGGNAECGKEILLYRSAPVSNEQWQTLTFPINPTNQITYIILEAGYAQSLKTYGNILIDNIRIESNTIGLGTNQFLCSGSTKQLTVQLTGANVLWNTGATETSIIVNESGTYSVVVEKGGCTLKDTITLKYLQPLAITLGKDTTICPGDTLTFSVKTENGQYQWNTSAQTPMQQITKAGNYDVIVNNGCEQVRASFEIGMDKTKCCYLEAPNVFTPNDDTVNDFFEVSSSSTLQKFNITIYNRWGEVIFETDELTSYWNGNTRVHEKAASGVYYWVASFSCGHPNLKIDNVLKGTLSLLR